MNRRSRLFPYMPLVSAAVLSCWLAVSAAPSVAFANDTEQAKLKELQRALNAPTEEAEEFSAKSIVFDKDSGPDASRSDTQPQKSEGAADCSLLPADVKTTSVDFEIQFKLGSADLSPASENTVMQIAKILALTPNRCVLVEGHTDAKGNPDVNLRLSRERANSVVKFIVEKAGVLRSRLVTIGKGSTEPLRNLDPRDPKNRRVVFKVAG